MSEKDSWGILEGHRLFLEKNSMHAFLSKYTYCMVIQEA